MNLIIPPEAEVEAYEPIVETMDVLNRRLCACGRMFTPYRSFQRYCCDEHRVKYAGVKPSTYVKKPEETVKCKECGKEFRTNDSKRHYCSTECYEEFQHKRHKDPETRICMVCGKEFVTAHWSKRYCSTECRLAARSI